MPSLSTFESNNASKAPSFAAELAGEMAARVRAFDWSRTPLGPISRWPLSLRALVDLILSQPIPMIILWGPGLTQIYNDGWAVVAGAKHPAALGQPNHQCWPELRHHNDPIYERVLSRGESVFLDDQLIPLDRSGRGVLEEAYFTVSYSPARDDGGGVGGIFVTVVEVTEKVLAAREAQRRATEEATRAARERVEFLSRAVEDSSQPFGSGYPDGRLMTVNKAFCELTGYTEDELRSITWATDLTPPEWREHEARCLAELRRTGRPQVYEKEYVRKDGTRVPLEIKCHLATDAAGAPLYYYSFVNDISERKAAEAERDRLLDAERAARAEAERQGRMKDEFLATLSHELRTPLNAILGWAQILGRGDGAGVPEDVRQGLEVIERNARAQTRIIDDLLDMSRIIAGKVRLDVQRIPLAPVIEAAAETVRPAAGAKGVRLQVVLDPLAGPVGGDPARLQQVFWNLLSNSVKHTRRGGRVQVVLERVDSHLEVSVADDGEGITPEFLPHVFDRFRQQDASTTRRHGGLGLGLSIVKQLVEMHGGSVRAKSPGPGGGATFTVVLPLPPVRPDPEAQESRRRHQRSHVGHGVTLGDELSLTDLRVLVVDDEADARELVKRILADRGAVVITAGSAADAVDAVRRERPDVIVSDIGMPGEDGYSLIRRVRALPPADGGGVPAVALTAYARSEDRTRALISGFTGHMAKPVEPVELVVTVAALARRKGRA